MAKGDAYIGLKNYLQKRDEEKITLSFEKIEKVVNHKLPKSASKDRI